MPAAPLGRQLVMDRAARTLWARRWLRRVERRRRLPLPRRPRLARRPRVPPLLVLPTRQAERIRPRRHLQRPLRQCLQAVWPWVAFLRARVRGLQATSFVVRIPQTSRVPGRAPRVAPVQPAAPVAVSERELPQLSTARRRHARRRLTSRTRRSRSATAASRSLGSSSTGTDAVAAATSSAATVCLTRRVCRGLASCRRCARRVRGTWERATSTACRATC
mmetsp:Transcript_9594/g.33719  ORF Transcript_9594/g.33719 Transcript_9594/m.33719 type:complete len:220 (-) Transcript_9594:6233-6892(-)